MKSVIFNAEEVRATLDGRKTQFRMVIKEHPCQFPVGLIERLVLSMTRENDMVFDPFAGSGTTFVASLLNKRKCAGAETENKYIKIATDRIIKSLSGEIKIREMNKPIYQPTDLEQ